MPLKPAKSVGTIRKNPSSRVPKQALGAPASRRRLLRDTPRAKQPARSAKHLLSHQVVREILIQTRAPGFGTFLTNLLVELCRINTTPNPDVAIMRKAEDRCFEILERELGNLEYSAAALQRRPINPSIQTHPNYSLLHFTKNAARPQGLSPEEVYAGRSNLVYLVPGTGEGNSGTSVALNAHVDVVAPYFPPRARGGIVYGRGACDDKGPVAGLVAALKVLSKALAKTGVRLNRNLVAMFVVEEETGGNGSLSLATDRELKRWYDSVLVSECTGLKIHPANRGAVWYRAELHPPESVSAFELFAFINEEMEKEGAAIRAESRHALFPQRPVQTCHGIIGPFGEHPSRICGEMNFSVRFQRPPNDRALRLVQDCLEAGLASYIGLYGDKTAINDPATGKPMVARHYDLRQKRGRIVVAVHGAAGHMGSIRERDGAITKAAHLVRSLVRSKARLEKLGSEVCFELGSGTETTSSQNLVLEGGQGFVPTHPINEVMRRLQQAAQRGAANYLNLIGRNKAAEQIVRITYEKLHNVAFDGDPNSPTMANALAGARACGVWNGDPVLGWTVSCDARLFATEYPNMPVLTFGPGQLVHAHSDHEQIAIEEIRKAAEFIALFVLLQTRTVPDSK